MSPKPTDPTLYAKVKAQIEKKIPKHSAYRSGHIVREYKKQFKSKHGDKKQPYHGAAHGKGPKKLDRWFKEKWQTQDGKKTYQKKNDIFRPTKRISKDTPVTMKELTPSEIKRAQKEKQTTGRVKRFRFPGKMVEKIVKFEKAPGTKKYKVQVQNSDGKLRSISFGAKKYQQFTDSTPLKAYQAMNHKDPKRRKAYFQRHSGVTSKKEALSIEVSKSKGKFTPKILAHKFLW